MHWPAVPETHFMLGRMRINVDQRRIHIQVQHIGWLARMEKYVAIGLLYSTDNNAVANSPTIEKNK